MGTVGRWGRPVALPARRGGDNDPRSCLGSLSVMSAKTPIHPFNTPCQCAPLEVFQSLFSPNQEGDGFFGSVQPVPHIILQSQYMLVDRLSTYGRHLTIASQPTSYRPVRFEYQQLYITQQNRRQILKSDTATGRLIPANKTNPDCNSCNLYC